MNSAASAFSRNLQSAREIRNRYVEGLEKGFKILNILLAIFGAIVLISGIIFVLQHADKDGPSLIDGVQRLAILLLVVYTFATALFSCLGLVIIKKRSCHAGCIALYGFLLFIVAFLIPIIHGSGFT